MTTRTSHLLVSQTLARTASCVWLVAAAAFVASCDGDEKLPPVISSNGDSSKTQDEDESGPSKSKAFDPASLVERLRKAEWNAEAAKNVVELNTRWFRILAEEDADELERQEGLLLDLGLHPDVFPVLREHPELAGVLAAAISVEERGPEVVARGLGDAERYDLAANLFAVYLEPESVLKLARVLETDGDLIAGLTARRIPHPENIFLTLPADPDASNVYQRWLREYLRDSLRQDDEALLQCVTVIYEAGGGIRRHLESSRQFRERFLEEIWPSFCRIVSDQPDSALLLLCDPRVWDVLSGEHGEALVARWGPMAADLLDPDNFPAELHANVVEALLAGDNDTVGAIVEFGKEPLFRDLLRRPGLSGQVRAKVICKLKREGPNYPQLLRDYMNLPNSALADEVGPPPDGPVTWIPLYYTLYEVPKKLIGGREVSGIDVFLAILDPVLLATGPLGPKDIAKAGLQQVGKRTTNEALKRGAVSAARTQVARVLEGEGGRIAGTLTEKELAPWVFKNLLRETRIALATKLEQAATVEVTGMVRSLFAISGLKRDTFRRLTSLEARLFMRPDARVFIRFDRLVQGNHFLARFLQETAADGGINTVLQSDPGEQLIRGGAELAVTAEKSTANQLEAWQQHISAAWLSAGTKFLDRAASCP